MENNQQPSENLLKQINTSFDFKRLIGAILSNWYWFVLTVSVLMTAGFLYLRYTTPQFSISSQILIDESNSENPGANVLSKLNDQNGGMQDQGSKNLYNEMIILKSRDLISKVVDSLALNIRYFSIGRIKETEIYQECPIKVVFDTGGYKDGYSEFSIKQIVDGQFEIRQNKNVERVLYDSWIKRPFGRFKIVYTTGPQVNKGYLANTEIMVRVESPTQTNLNVLANLKINPDDGRTSLIDVGYNDNIPQRGVDMMNILIKFYQKIELENITRSAEKTREFLTRRKSSINIDLRSLDTAEENIKIANSLISPETQTDEFLASKTASEQKTSELIQQKNSIDGLKRQVLSARNQIIAGVSVSDPALAQLITAYNAGIQQLETYQANYGDQNPFLLKTESDVASLRKRIAEAIDHISGELDVQIRNSASNTQDYTNRIRTVPGVDRNIKEATRGYDVLQSMYLLIYQKEIENDITQYAQGNKSRVVTVPYSPGTPIKPVPKTIYGMMLLIGLLIPGTIIVVREMINNTVINENDIEALTNIPVIGSISRVETEVLGESVIVVGPHIRTGVAEQFRLIRANLEFMSSSNSKKVFVITSSRSGEGKSFTSINLGITMTLAKKRVVIMEFDLRKPQITNQLGLSNEGGISSYLAGFTDLDSVIKASGIHENLYIANCGPIPPNPGELLVLPTTSELITKLQDMFDVVIIDTAPIGLVSDALILSQYASINVFVVRQSLTVKDQVRMFDVLYKDRKIQHPAIIFNGVLYLKKYGYGYGGGNAYGYSYGQGGYGNGYYEEAPTSKKKKKGNFFERFFTK